MARQETTAPHVFQGQDSPEELSSAMSVSELVQELAPLLQNLGESIRTSGESQAESNERFALDVRQSVVGSLGEQPRGRSGATIGKFKGPTPDGDLWIDQFNQLANLNKWEDEHKISALPLFLQGNALTYYSTLPQEVRQDYDAVSKALCDHFGASSLHFLERQELYSHLQKPEESIND
eukprot:gene3998-biopygen2482